MLKSVKRHPNRRLSDTLILEGSPDELIGVEKTESDDPFDMVAGYVVVKTQSGRHDGFPAVTITLADEMGHRDIGRMTVRMDAVHEEILTWERCFPGSTGDAESFLESFENRDLTPAGWRKIKARQVEVGMLVADTELWPEAYPVKSMHLFPLEEDGPWTRDTLPSGVGVAFDAWADPFDSEDDVLVKES